MASTCSTTLPVFFITFMSRVCFIICPSVIEDLNNLKPPPDFNTTITNNCIINPSLRYCNSTEPFDLLEIFQSTIVASHLCNVSGNPNCVESFPKIDLHNKPHIAPLYLSFDFFWKYCPLTIMSIDVSNNSLKGKFPSQVFYCSQIHDLDLSNNSFSGDVPIDNFSSLPNLTFLNLSYNMFWEIGNAKSHDFFFKRFNSSSFIHSGILVDERKLIRLKLVILLVVLPTFLLAIISCSCWLVSSSRPDYLPCCFYRRNRFTQQMLKAATNGFSRKNLVGQSNSLDVYYGKLRDGSEVRIELYKDILESCEDRQTFDAKCKVLTQLNHKNLIEVMGWCDDEKRNFRAIVSEWIDGENNNNVESWLVNSAPSLEQRMKVIVGIFKGIRYVHEECPQVECNLKTNKILLNKNREPLISRFKVSDDEDEGSITKKVIYKFGVFLLEMVSNRRPNLQEFESGEIGFLRYIKVHYPQDLHVLIDERMKKTEVVTKQAKELIKLGLLCSDLSGVRAQPGWDQISHVLSKNSSSLVFESSTQQRRNHCPEDQRGKGKQVQKDGSDDDDEDDLEMNSHPPFRSVTFH
ncbi:OLC1v1022162C1 [Oldenlandia corymbosa var. corymbosa]|uniref:OLC1v1022162C1 n=1 Tax=Oldenlandia corymbosa var. corymbosa TaxID=529605 RepID=A0AAV1BZV3_OLDCO|nr:OLC1v1022162C1 [Oldenlandia corymbosa var. corymbosa]